MGVVVGGTAAAFTIGHIWLNDLWWKGTKTDFHFNTQQDYEYALNADKLGHAFFVFLNAENQRICVLYARRAGTYGLIEPVVGGRR